MTPYYEEDGITIYHGDCREILPGLGRFDSVVTDPPYGVDIAEWDAEVPYAMVPTLLGLVDGPIVWFGSAPGLVADCKAFDPSPMRTLIWAPKFTLSRIAKDGIAYRWHPIYCWQLPAKHCGPVWDVLDDMTGGRKWWNYKCTKPESLMSKLVRFTQEGGRILDPFMGSGTTLRAAKDNGYKGVGIDTNEQACEIAAKRLSQGVLPLWGER